jgi:hypothetical protein
MNMQILCRYNASNSEIFEMPKGRVWSDVESYYVKWGHLHLIFRDRTVHTIELDMDVRVDTKRPVSIKISEEEPT